jgi:hypothetical protein
MILEKLKSFFKQFDPLVLEGLRNIALLGGVVAIAAFFGGIWLPLIIPTATVSLYGAGYVFSKGNKKAARVWALFGLIATIAWVIAG